MSINEADGCSWKDKAYLPPPNLDSHLIQSDKGEALPTPIGVNRTGGMPVTVSQPPFDPVPILFILFGLKFDPELRYRDLVAYVNFNPRLLVDATSRELPVMPVSAPPRSKEEDSLCGVDTNGAHAIIALTWLLNHPMEYCLRFVSSEVSLYSSCFHISRTTISKESTMADIQLALAIRHCRKISHQNIPFSLTLEVENEFIVNHA